MTTTIEFTRREAELLSEAECYDEDAFSGLTLRYFEFEPEASKDGAGGVKTAIGDDFSTLRSAVILSTDKFMTQGGQSTERPAHWRDVARGLRRKLKLAD